MSASELSGSWTYRMFNPTLADQTAPQRERELIRADADLTIYDNSNHPRTLEGMIEWLGPREIDGLDLNGTINIVRYDAGGAQVPVFEFVGNGRPGTGTVGWEYRYYGHWVTPLAERSAEMTLAGSVLRAKTHNGNPPRSPAGEVFSFIAVKPPLGGIPGKYTYRSFLNNPTYPYLTAPPTADGLILQEADLRLEAPTSTTLRGTISWPGRSLDIQGRVGTIEGFPSSFWITGTGGGWERRYQGFLTRHWAEGLNQVPALVGSVINVLPPPGGYAAPFIAVKRQ